MDVDEFFAPRVLIVSGKGGVGKTTVSAALAVVAARRGRTVCIAEVDRKGTLPKIFGAGDLDYEPREIAPGIWGMSVSPDEALAEYLRVQYHMRRIARVFTSTQFVDYVTTAAPGLKDILVLGKIWYLEQGRSDRRIPRFDTIIVDAPAAGHMLTFLQAPIGLSDAIRMGPVRRQSDWLIEMLRDPERTRAHIVTLAEEMPVAETIETAEALTERVGIEQGPIFANAIYADPFTAKEHTRIGEADLRRPLAEEAEGVGLALHEEDLDAMLGYAQFLGARKKIQSAHLKTLKSKTSQPVVELPFLFTTRLTLPEIEVLADVIDNAIPAA